MTPEQIAENVKRLREQDPKNEFVGTQTINALVKLVGEIRWVLSQSEEKLLIEAGGSREYKGGVPTQFLFPRIEEALTKAAPIAALEEA